MDRPVLHAFVRELVQNERLGELAEALPTRARVSEAALPVVLASLYERLERPLVCLFAEDADARDAAEAAAWFLGDDAVGYLPSRGVRWESGLQPPPHLVGERARALAVLARGGLVCASAHAVAEALPPLEACAIRPAAERRRDLVEEGHGDEGETRPVPSDLVPALDRVPDFVFQPDDVRRVWDEDNLAPVSLDGTTELDPFPQSQPFAFEAQRPAIAARGLSEAESELAQFVRAGQRVVVAFPHRGEALRTQNMLRRDEAQLLEPGDELPDEAGLFFAAAPARRGFVWRDLGLVLLPDHQVFRRRVPRERRLGGKALQSFADLRTGDFVVHEDHGVGKLLGFETKEVAGVTRDYLLLAFRGDDRLYVPHEQLGKVSRYVGADSTAPALSKLGGKAWDNLKTRARESVHELASELDRKSVV